jgi:predicted nucleic-acid-binding protein
LKGLDTNVLVRFLTDDHPAQAAVALQFIERAESRGERLFVNTIVLAELVWTLEGGAHRYSRDAIAGAIRKLLGVAVFEVQSREDVRRALDDFERGAGDFADYLIGRENESAGCDNTATFDRKLSGRKEFAVLRSR